MKSLKMLVSEIEQLKSILLEKDQQLDLKLKTKAIERQDYNLQKDIIRILLKRLEGSEPLAC